MTNEQKLTTIKTILADSGEVPSDETLSAYITLAANEILSWLYWDIGGVPEDVTDVPAKYDGVHIFAVIAGIDTCKMTTKEGECILNNY